MFKKKLLALALATVMTLSTSVVAFAATTGVAGSDNTTTYNFSATATSLAAGAVTATGTVQQPTIEVTVPTVNEYIINPYQLAVNAPKADGSGAETGTTQDQIISPTYTITSKSDVALTVNIQTKATVTSGVSLTTSAIAANDSKKDVLLYVNFDVTTPTGASDLTSKTFNADGTQSDKTSFSEGEIVYAIDKSQIEKDGDTYKITDDVKALITSPSAYVVTTTAKTYTDSDKNKTNYTLVTYKFLADGEYDAKSANQVAVTTSGATKTGIATLAANKTSGTTATYSFKGKTSTNPTTPWSSNDKVTATLTFSFTPVVTEITAP